MKKLFLLVIIILVTCSSGVAKAQAIPYDEAAEQYANCIVIAEMEPVVRALLSRTSYDDLPLILYLRRDYPNAIDDVNCKTEPGLFLVGPYLAGQLSKKIINLDLKLKLAVLDFPDENVNFTVSSAADHHVMLTRCVTRSAPVTSFRVALNDISIETLTQPFMKCNEMAKEKGVSKPLTNIPTKDVKANIFIELIKMLNERGYLIPKLEASD